MVDQSIRGSIRFRPVDKKDFSVRARAYQRMTGVKLSQAQELLSRIYGYAHLHELQWALSRPEDTGPFDDSLDTPVCADPDARRLRLIAITAAFKAQSGQQDWSWLGGAGFFCTPPEFRRRLRVLREMAGAEADG